MKILFATLTFLLSVSAMAAPKVSSLDCAPDAIEQTEKLLRFHSDMNPGEQIPNHVVPSMSDVKALPQENVLVGKGKLDVLEVTTGIYKAQYRVKVSYAKIADPNNPNGFACLLMGQGIVEVSNPY